MVTTNTSDRNRLTGIFKYLVKEEVRFHTELFGLTRFVGFPAFIIVLISAGLFGAEQLGLGTTTEVLLSVHGLFFIIALQIGSVAFMANDAAADLLGGRSTLLYSHSYLPVKQETLIVLFAIKDILFYLGLFVIPAVVSTVFFLPLTLTQLGVLFISLSLMFSLGIAASLFLASLGLKSRSQSVVLTVSLITGLLALFTQTSLSIADVLVYTAPTPIAQLGVAVGTLVLIVGFSAYSSRNLELSQDSDQRVTYAWLLDPLLEKKQNRGFNQNNVTSAIMTRTLADVLRSGGGFFKIGFTVAVLIGLTAYLLDALYQTTSIMPEYALTVAAIIGLSSYANYVWIFQNDSPADYSYLPVTSGQVKEAKRYTFHLINTGILFLATVSAGVLFESSILSVVGTLVFVVGLTDFYFEFTYKLAGFEPMDFLFDTVRFSFFSVVLMILFIPILVVGLFGPLFMSTSTLFITLIGLGIVLLLAGAAIRRL